MEAIMAKGRMFLEKRVHKRLDKDYEIFYNCFCIISIIGWPGGFC